MSVPHAASIQFDTQLFLIRNLLVYIGFAFCMVNQCFAIALVVYDSKEKVTGFIEKCMNSPNMCGENTKPSFLHVYT